MTCCRERRVCDRLRHEAFQRAAESAKRLGTNQGATTKSPRPVSSWKKLVSPDRECCESNTIESSGAQPLKENTTEQRQKLHVQKRSTNPSARQAITADLLRFQKSILLSNAFTCFRKFIPGLFTVVFLTYSKSNFEATSRNKNRARRARN